MRNFFFIFGFTLLLICNHETRAGTHPFYVSIIQLDHNLNTGNIEATFKIFTDDLENAVYSEQKINLKLGGRLEAENADSVLFKFIKNHFYLKINGEEKMPEYIGFEPEFDVSRIYLEYENIDDSVQKIEVNCDLLVDHFADQSNIIHYEKNSEIESLILNKQNRIGIMNPDK